MSDAVPSVLQARDRSWNYWSADGLFSIIQGIAILLQGLGYLIGHLHKRSLVAILLVFIAVSIQIDLVFPRKLVGWLKTRIVYPRTGYVAPPKFARSLPDRALLSQSDREQLRKRKWLWIWLWTSVAVSFALSYFAYVSSRRWIFFPATAWPVLFIWYLARKSPKFAWYQTLPILAYGALIAYLPTDLMESIAMGLIAVGLYVISLGGTMLSRYLHEHPPAQV